MQKRIETIHTKEMCLRLVCFDNNDLISVYLWQKLKRKCIKKTKYVKK